MGKRFPEEIVHDILINLPVEIRVSRNHGVL